jgi:hypothetical protein
MSAPSELVVTELDFDTIKAALITFMQSQTEFADYNFEGAALNVLIDLLAYNSHYSSVLSNLIANEQFIDTAIKRSSVLSIARTLGYTPASTTCSVATVTIIVTPSEMSPGATLTLPTSTTFNAQVNNTSYTFNVEDTLTVNLTNGVYTFPNVNILEGARLSNSFTVAPDTITGPFNLPVQTIDTNTLQVAVQNSPTDLTTTMFTPATTVIDVNNTDAIFWVEEQTDGTYSIIFGDNVIGKSLVQGNIVAVSYIATNGPAAHGANSFALNGAIVGETNVAVQLINPSAAGGAKEDIDTIRFNAPKFRTTNNRVVTADDYSAMIIEYTPNAQSVVVWGGEDNVPPVYGTVFISIDPKPGYVITQNDMDNLIDNVLKPRAVMTVVHQFVAPEPLYLGFDVTITYDPRKTNFSASDLSALVNNQIQTYFATNLATLDRTFFFSAFSDSLSGLNPAILGILVNMRLQRRITQSQSFNTTQNLQFLAALEPSSIRSTIFVSTVNGVTFNAYIQDFANDSILNNNGIGTLKLLDSVTNAVLVPNLGSVDYGQGILTISNLNITTYLGNLTNICINATPQTLSRNITTRTITSTATSTGAVIPLPSRNIVLDLDDSVVNSGINLLAGVNINAVSYIAA